MSDEIEVVQVYRCSDGSTHADYHEARKHEARLPLRRLVKEAKLAGEGYEAPAEALEGRADAFLRALLPFASPEFHDEMRENY